MENHMKKAIKKDHLHRTYCQEMSTYNEEFEDDFRFLVRTMHNEKPSYVVD
jgi:hypothetical protein